MNILDKSEGYDYCPECNLIFHVNDYKDKTEGKNFILMCPNNHVLTIQEMEDQLSPPLYYPPWSDYDDDRHPDDIER
jgi:hypothetical protein